MNNDEKEFLELAGDGEESDSDSKPTEARRNRQPRSPFDDDDSDDGTKKEVGTLCQYARYSSGFFPTTSTLKSLKSGCYEIRHDSNIGAWADPMPSPHGLLLELPEMRSDDVIKVVENFWSSEKDYKEGNEFVHGGAIFKAGILLFGPPGSGKSCTIKIISKKLVERGGIVFFAGSHPAIVLSFLTNFSRIEPDRKCIVILEDVDTLVENYGEATYLEMLDSAKAIDNALFIATTNYPERLDPRIYNRPGRFSSVMKVGLPTKAAREAYLRAILKNHKDVEEIVSTTENFTIDHLSALVNGVYREKKNLKDEIHRLKTLFKVPSTKEGPGLGLGSK